MMDYPTQKVNVVTANDQGYMNDKSFQTYKEEEAYYVNNPTSVPF